MAGLVSGTRRDPRFLQDRLGHFREWRAHSLHVIEPTDGAIASLTIDIGPLGPELFGAFGLPPVRL